MQRRKQFTLGIITLLLLCILAGCQFGNQKKKTEKKVDYYIGVVDNRCSHIIIKTLMAQKKVCM